MPVYPRRSPSQGSFDKMLESKFSLATLPNIHICMLLYVEGMAITIYSAIGLYDFGYKVY